MPSTLWQRYGYLANISYMNNTFIHELDIQKANISILYWKGAISQSEYDTLFQAERMVRQVYIGKLQRDNPNISKILKEGIIEAKQALFEANNIQDSDVLAIKNDAVYVIGTLPQYLEFGIVKFIPKNIYTGYYKLGNLELYYYYNKIGPAEKLDVKGISSDALALHAEYFYRFLCDLFYIIQCEGIIPAQRMLKHFYIQYIGRMLPVGFYRQFNTISKYHLRSVTSNGVGFQIADEYIQDPRLLDITANLKHLVDLNKVLTTAYFKNR